ncbi:MAG: TonB-dependent siderophore receptor [Hyphomicrobium sp.]
MAIAQDAPSSAGSSADLPPVTVESAGENKNNAPPEAKKKSQEIYAPAKKSPKKSQAADAPQAAETYEATGGDPSGATSGVARAPGSNPYANPTAPYKVETSGSSKFTEPLANTPKSITALPKEVIKDKGATDLRELARQTPGVTIHSGEGGASFGSNFEIRGFNARNDIFVDGIRDPGNIGRDIFAIEQLEIYKGPSGTISGRATPGGAFNFITKQPDFEGNFYEVETTVGTDETFRTTLDANQVFGPGIAARANILYDQHDVAGRDFTEDERWGGLLSVALRPNEDFQVNLDYYRVRRDGMPDAGVPVSPAAGLPFTEVGLDRDTFFGQLSLDYLDEESDVGTAKIKAKLAEGVTLTNTIRYGENYSAYIQTAARPAATQTDINGSTNTTNPQRIQETSLFANQTALNWEFALGGFRHEVVTGVEYSREKIDRGSHTITTISAPGTIVPILNPDPFRDPRVWNGVTSRTYKADIEDIGFYISDTIHLSDQWIVNGGVRYDDFTRDQIGGPTSPNNTAKVDEGLLSWNTGIVFKPIPIASFYAAYGYTESPIGNEIDSTGGEYNGLTIFTAGLPPEETRGFEFGTKWELFDRRLLATAAIFETVKDNARTNRGVNNATVPIENGSAGKYRVRGIELGVAGNITDQWSMFGGVVFMDTEALQSDVAAEVGRRLANTPLTQFALLSKYAITPNLTLGGQAIYQSEFYAGHFVANDTGYRSVPYWRFDAMAEYKIDDNWSVEVLGTNLTDELYYDAIYQAANSFAYVAPGRAGYLTVKWSY